MSRLTVSRCRPASRSALRLRSQQHAVGGHRQVPDRGTGRQPMNESGRSRRRSGSPPVRRTLSTPSAREDVDQRLDFLELQDVLARQPDVIRLGHAVAAPQVAPVGDRETEVPERPLMPVEDHWFIMTWSGSSRTLRLARATATCAGFSRTLRSPTNGCGRAAGKASRCAGRQRRGSSDRADAGRRRGSRPRGSGRTSESGSRNARSAALRTGCRTVCSRSADPARQVARIDVLETCIVADACCPLQHRRASSTPTSVIR